MLTTSRVAGVGRYGVSGVSRSHNDGNSCCILIQGRNQITVHGCIAGVSNPLHPRGNRRRAGRGLGSRGLVAEGARGKTTLPRGLWDDIREHRAPSNRCGDCPTVISILVYGDWAGLYSQLFGRSVWLARKLRSLHCRNTAIMKSALQIKLI